jgi:hypothetical protein
MLPTVSVAAALLPSYRPAPPLLHDVDPVLGWLVLAVFVTILLALLTMMLRPKPHRDDPVPEVDATVPAPAAGVSPEGMC